MKLVLAVVVVFAVSVAGTAGFVALKGGGEGNAAEQGTSTADSIASTADTSSAQSIDSAAAPDSHEDASSDSADQSEPDDPAAEIRDGMEQPDTATGSVTVDARPVSLRPPGPALTQSGASRSASMVNAIDELERQQQAYKQVARILSNMRESDVAQILAHIQDDDVEGILRQLTARDAAKLLSELPAQRAARLSERLLRTVPQAGGTR